jgi:hypothetical protein
MRKLMLIVTLLTLASSSQAALKIHEWGTFTSLVGSDGITQHGMYHEDEALPEFVHGFGQALPRTESTTAIDAAVPDRTEKVSLTEPTPVPVPTVRPYPHPCRPNSKSCLPQEFIDQNQITQKMETPVIYFYSDKEQVVDINVKFPEGVISETYPAPVSTSPGPNSEPVLANGDTTFKVGVLSPGDSLYAHKFFHHVPAGNIYGHARRVKSNVVQSGNEYERFIFYRGLGRFQPDFKFTSSEGGFTIANTKLKTGAIPAAYLVYVNQLGEVRAKNLGAIGVGQTVKVTGKTVSYLMAGVSTGGLLTEPALFGALSQSLKKSGLTEDESNAMLNTWSHGYFKVPGLRLLYILSSNEVERVLPMTISPKPDELVRTFVGRIELLLNTREQDILADILKNHVAFKPESLGRFAEPTLRRVLQVYEKNETSEGRQPDPKFVHIINKMIIHVSQAAPGKITGAVH